MSRSRSRLETGEAVSAAVLAVAALVWVWLAQSFNRTRDYAGPVACATNLRRIGDGIMSETAVIDPR